MTTIETDSRIMGRTASISIDGMLRAVPLIKDEGRKEFTALSADAMQSEIKKFGPEVQAIRTDRTLNQRGEATKLREAYDACCTRLDEIVNSAQAGDYQRRAEFVQSRFGSPFAKLRGGKCPGAKETRELLRGVLKETNGDAKVVNMFMEAAHDGTVSLLAAVADSPAGFPLVSDDTIAEAERIYERILWPDENAELDCIEATLDTLKFNAATARHMIQRRTGLSFL